VAGIAGAFQKKSNLRDEAKNCRSENHAMGNVLILFELHACRGPNFRPVVV